MDGIYNLIDLIIVDDGCTRSLESSTKQNREPVAEKTLSYSGIERLAKKTLKIRNLGLF